MQVKDMTHISRWLDENDIKYELGIDLSQRTWIKNGGIARIYITPHKVAQLESLLLRLLKFDERYIVIGHTSNMFFSNSYDLSIIISTRKVNEFVIEGNKVLCECGASLKNVTRTCMKQGIAGYEGLIGIPGTVGAAVCNNSGAYDCEMSKLVKRVEVLLDNGEKVWLTKNDLEYSYRNSAIKSGKIKCCVLRAELSSLNKNDPEILQAMAEENMANRNKHYEGYNNNLGTVFSSMDIFSGRVLLRLLLKIHRKATVILPFSVQNKTRMFLILAYFNKLNLYPFISEKRINCFVWNKNKGYEDRVFYEYIEFIKSKSSSMAVLELQIIDEKMDSSTA